jgi:uncharacterized protein YbbK (DUF523 family)
MLNYPVTIGISSCLLGQSVRYDGDHKFNSELVEKFNHYIDWHPVCPEVGAGMGIPRPPIQLSVIENSVHAIQVENPDIDVTDQLQNFNQSAIPGLSRLCGYVFKARSPSCGVIDTPIEDNDSIRTGSGLFAAAVQSAFPFMPVTDENQLLDDDAWNRFVEHSFLYARWLNLLDQHEPDVALRHFHRQHYYQFMTHDPAALPRIESVASSGSPDDYWQQIINLVDTRPDSENCLTAMRQFIDDCQSDVSLPAHEDPISLWWSLIENQELKQLALGQGVYFCTPDARESALYRSHGSNLA